MDGQEYSLSTGEELNKQLTEERDQFLERYYRLVTQFELMGGSFERARRHHRCNRILARFGPRSTNDMKYLRCRCLSPSAMAMAMVMD